MIFFEPSFKHFKNNDYFISPYKHGSSLHFHNEIEFMFILEGSLEVSLNGNVVVANEGDLVVVNKAVVHSSKIKNRPASYFVLMISEDFFKLSNLYPKNTYLKTLITSETVKKIFNSIIKEYNKKDEFSNVSNVSNIINLFVHLNRNYTSTPSVDQIFETKKILLVKNTINYLQNNFKEKLNIEKIANALYFSKSYICHTFKEITKLTIVDYLNVIRCQNAKTMILNDYSITDTAIECGFSELSYFSKVFKKTMGVLPSQIVKNND